MKKYLIIPNLGELALDELKEQVTELKKLAWDYAKWTYRTALIDKISGTTREFVGQSYDPKHFELVDDGWRHDHCEICYASISEGETNENFEIDGFHSANSWLCTNCYKNFVEPTNFDLAIQDFEVAEK